MTESRFRTIMHCLLGISGIIILFLIWVSVEAITETENRKFFDLDFKNREGVISSYGSLLAGLLSFVSILFVLLDLTYQRRLKSQEDEQRDAAINQRLKYNLEIITLFVDRLRDNVIKQSEECLQFVELEKNRPTKVNKMSFYPNTFPKMILEVDRVSFFESLSVFKPGENWRNLYVNLFKTVDFYENSYEEIFSKYQIHLDKMVAMSMDIASNIDDFVDEVSSKRNDMIQSLPKGSISSNPFYELLHSTNIKFQDIISARNQIPLKDQFENEDPASMSVWSSHVLQPFFDGTLNLWRKHGGDRYNFNEKLLPLTQKLIRQIDMLIRDSLDYANHIEEYAKKYLVKDAGYVQKLEKTSNELNSSLNQ